MAEFIKDSLSEFLRQGALVGETGRKAAVKMSSGVGSVLTGFGLTESTESIGVEAPGSAAGPDEVMAYLRTHGATTPTALLKALGVAPTPGVALLERLEKYGLLVRESQDGAVVVRAAG